MQVNYIFKNVAAIKELSIIFNSCSYDAIFYNRNYLEDILFQIIKEMLNNNLLNLNLFNCFIYSSFLNSHILNKSLISKNYSGIVYIKYLDTGTFLKY